MKVDTEPGGRCDDLTLWLQRPLPWEACQGYPRIHVAGAHSHPLLCQALFQTPGSHRHQGKDAPLSERPVVNKVFAGVLRARKDLKQECGAGQGKAS